MNIRSSSTEENHQFSNKKNQSSKRLLNNFESGDILDIVENEFNTNKTKTNTKKSNIKLSRPSIPRGNKSLNSSIMSRDFEDKIISLMLENESILKKNVEIEHGYNKRITSLKEELKEKDLKISLIETEKLDLQKQISKNNHNSDSIYSTIDEYYSKFKSLQEVKDYEEGILKRKIDELTMENKLLLMQINEKTNLNERLSKEKINLEEEVKKIKKESEEKVKNMEKSFELRIISKENEKKEGILLKNENLTMRKEIHKLKNENKSIRIKFKRQNEALVYRIMKLEETLSIRENQIEESNSQLQFMKNKINKRVNTSLGLGKLYNNTSFRKQNNQYSNNNSNHNIALSDRNLHLNPPIFDLNFAEFSLNHPYHQQNTQQIQSNQLDYDYGKSYSEESFDENRLFSLEDLQGNDEKDVKVEELQREVSETKESLIRLKLEQAEYIFKKEEEFSGLFKIVKYLLGLIGVDIDKQKEINMKEISLSYIKEFLWKNYYGKTLQITIK